MAGQYQVSGIPCLILFKGGQPVDRIVGYVPENAISAMLGKHVAWNAIVPAPMRRRLPAVHRLLEDPAVARLRSDARARNDKTRGGASARPRACFPAKRTRDDASIRRRSSQELDGVALQELTPVINATGIIAHTNLGRVPLAREALVAVERHFAGYSNLEYDLDDGRRGSRYDRVAGLVCEIAGRRRRR